MSLLGFSIWLNIKPYEKKVSGKLSTTADRHIESRKKSLKNIILQLSKGYTISKCREGDGEEKGRPNSKWLEVIQMKDEIVSQMYKYDQRNGKRRWYQ